MSHKPALTYMRKFDPNKGRKHKIIAIKRSESIQRR